MQVGCSPNQRNMEIRKSRDLGDAPRAHSHGCWEIREQAWSRNCGTRSGKKKSIGQNTSINVPPACIVDDNVLSPLGVCGHTVEKTYSSIEKRTKSKESIQIVGGDFNAELGPAIGVERVSGGPNTPQRVKQKRRLDEAVRDATENSLR